MAKKNDYASRAKIFAPFAALKGFEEALKEKEKVLVSKKVISQEEKDKIGLILKDIKKNQMVEIVYYNNYNNYNNYNLNNGEYIKLKGLVSKIDVVYQEITIVQTKINFNDIYSIKIVD